MIRFETKDIFETGTQALVNTVNLEGVMGKGVALQFKERFKANFAIYKQACREKTIAIGRLLAVNEIWNGKAILVINFPTKTTWRRPSEISYRSRTK